MIWIQEEFVNRTEGYRFNESDIYETMYEDGEKGKLYRSLVRQYGRCTSKMYHDTVEGAKRIGWVFVKHMKYEDCADTYLQETWVSLHTGPPTKTVQYHYLEV